MAGEQKIGVTAIRFKAILYRLVQYCRMENAQPMGCEISGFAEAWGELAAARNADAERKTEIMTEAIENTESYMEEITAPTVQKLPLLAMRGIVLFPNMIMHFDLAREPFVKALRAGAKSDRRVFLVTQKDPLVEEPKQDDLYTVGVIAEVRQVLRSPDGVTRVLVEGKERAAITAAFLENTEKEKDFYPQAEVELLPEVSAEEDREKELAASPLHKGHFSGICRTDASHAERIDGNCDLRTGRCQDV